nr:LCCL domain-containing protein [Corallococcus exiguus]
MPNACSSYDFTSYRGQNGTRLRCNCGPVGGGTVWGTDLYTDDSNSCAAAVHAGVIAASGGNVTVTIQPGQASYTGTTRNGITTLSYGAWSGSYSLSP